MKQAGYYRVTQLELLTAGLDPGCDPHSLQLFVDGREQAISVAGESDGRFDSSDAVEFYGVGIDSPFTAAHNYFLTSAKQQGRRIEMLPSFAKPNPGGGFAFTTERGDRTIYFAGLLNGDAENFFGQVLTSQPVNQTLTVQHADLSATTTLEVAAPAYSLTARVPRAAAATRSAHPCASCRTSGSSSSH